MSAPSLPAAQLRRLRELYRSSGWPCQDGVEIELLAAGLVERVDDNTGPGQTHRLRVTDAGIAAAALGLQALRQRRSPHESLVERVALEMQRAGRIVWRGLALRAQLPSAHPPAPGAAPAASPLTAADASKEPAPLPEAPPQALAIWGAAEDAAWRTPAPTPRPRWCVAMPDVFSIRHTTVEAYCEPIVHEVKVSRADLLGDVRREDKRRAYLDLGGECWYVLGRDPKGRPIGDADDVPPECGVLVLTETGQLAPQRPAPRRAVQRLPFHVWMALARATPLPVADDPQEML